MATHLKRQPWSKQRHKSLVVNQEIVCMVTYTQYDSISKSKGSTFAPTMVWWSAPNTHATAKRQNRNVGQDGYLLNTDDSKIKGTDCNGCSTHSAVVSDHSASAKRQRYTKAIGCLFE
jgi:hypothetical protein